MFEDGTSSDVDVAAHDKAANGNISQACVLKQQGRRRVGLRPFPWHTFD